MFYAVICVYYLAYFDFVSTFSDKKNKEKYFVYILIIKFCFLSIVVCSFCCAKHFY